MVTIDITPAEDWAKIGALWQALEPACDGGFFRSWLFLGRQTQRRFTRARLLVARDGADIVGLALLGHTDAGLRLNETGNPTYDSVFIEHNGLLFQRGRADILPAALQAAARVTGTLALSGVDDAHLEAAGQAGILRHHVTRPAPFINLAALDRPYLETRSANTRAQIRRAQRAFGADLTLDRAATGDEALAFFDRLVAFHQASWKARGEQGAFAERDVLSFHAALIARGVPQGQVDLFRLRGGGRIHGYLYQFICQNTAYSYQSGFAPTQHPREKPGLVAHAMAVQCYATQGLAKYDFLAGDDRYKRSLADHAQNLHWATLFAPTRLRSAFELVRNTLKTTLRKE